MVFSVLFNYIILYLHDKQQLAVLPLKKGRAFMTSSANAVHAKRKKSQLDREWEDGINRQL
jgi:hypothetical protein